MFCFWRTFRQLHQYELFVQRTGQTRSFSQCQQTLCHQCQGLELFQTCFSNSLIFSTRLICFSSVGSGTPSHCSTAVNTSSSRKNRTPTESMFAQLCSLVSFRISNGSSLFLPSILT